jgi:hypothetical protein
LTSSTTDSNGPNKGFKPPKTPNFLTTKKYFIYVSLWVQNPENNVYGEKKMILWILIGFSMKNPLFIPNFQTFISPHLVFTTSDFHFTHSLLLIQFILKRSKISKIIRNYTVKISFKKSHILSKYKFISGNIHYIFIHYKIVRWKYHL